MARKYEWFIGALNPGTNEMIAARLAELQLAYDTVTALEVKGKTSEVAPGVTVTSRTSFSVWRVTYSFVAELNRARPKFPDLKFVVYCKRQGERTARPWLFGKKKLSRKVREMKNRIQTLQKK